MARFGVALSEDPVLDGVALDRLRSIGGGDLVRRMIELYLDGGPGRIRNVTEGAAAGDISAVERAAHSIKSSAGNLGAIRLQRTAEALEAAAAAGAIDARLVERIAQDFEASAAALRDVLEETT